MTLKEAHTSQYRFCIGKNLPVEPDGHYQTHFEFGSDPVFVNPDGSSVVSYRFNVSGCLKVITKENKTFITHKNRLPVYGRINNPRVRSFLYKYLLFLRCDGIDNPDMMELYLLHLMDSKMVFYTRNRDSKKKRRWVTYEPEYRNVKKMISMLITSALKKDIDDQTRTQFMVVSRCKVNPLKAGMVKKTRRERLTDAHRGSRKATDLKIKSLYDSTLTDEENSKKTGYSVPKIKEWKAAHPEWWESKKDRVRRLYDFSKSLRENAKLLNMSVNTVKKYIPVKEVEPVIEVKKEMSDQELDKWIEDAIDEWDLTH